MRVPIRACLLLSCLVFGGLAPSASARPEKIRAGHSYYSDDYVVTGLVHDIAAEKNYEEVYQSYRYYEAIYDEAGRVVTFKEYKRGEAIRVETYRYASDGALVERTVERPGRPPEITAVDADGAVAPEGAAP